jgi:hypothetical protein
METTMSKTLREKGNYRVKYWRWINNHYGEWCRTGLMKKHEAELIKKHLEISHEQVEVYKDDDGR